MTSAFRAAFVALVVFSPAVAAAPPKTDAEELAGVWLFDGCRMGAQSNLGMVWTSVVTITGDTFSITKVYDADKPLAGKLAVDPAKKAIDFKLDEFDLTPVGMPAKLPACTIAGLYELDGDTLTVAIEFDLAGKRPADFTHAKRRDTVLTLRRAPKGFKAFPKDVTVKAVGPDGKPVAGAIVCGYMHMQQSVMRLTDREGKKIEVNVLTMTPEELEKALAKLPDDLKDYVKNIVNPPAGTVFDKASGWSYHNVQKTSADGTAKVEFEKLRFSPVIVRDAERKQMGVLSVTPRSLLAGEVTVDLRPEVRVTAQGTCDEIAKAGVKLANDAFNSYIETTDGSRIAFCGNREGKLEYLVPAGEYLLNVYGSEAMGKKRAAIVVPANQSEYAAPPVDLPATGLHKLIGKPAPELSEIAAWKGPPVKLADLNGKVVLLEFWGYWCGPCVASMPDLFKIHDEFKDKGVVIVGIHVDTDGDLTTVEQLDEKLAEFKRDIWKGRDLPFSVAMTSGRVLENDARGGLADKYGIRGYPSTVLIGRDGKVVGKFHARDAAAAAAQLKNLLAEKK